MTATTLIKQALGLIGVRSPGEPLKAGEAQDALVSLQGMLGQWATQNLTMFAPLETTVSLVVDQQDYTVGAGGDVNIARPTFIERISLIDNTDASAPLELPVSIIRTSQQWQAVRLKLLESTWPQAVYVQMTFPLVTLSLWPIPTGTSLQMRIYSKARVTGFADLTTVYTFPDGYDDALAYNLAVRLAPIFGVGASIDLNEVKAMARETLANIKRVNIRPETMTMPVGIMGHRGGYYDYRSDE